jgi:hypothetical protein
MSVYDEYYSEPVELQAVLTRIEALPPRAGAWVHQELIDNGDVYTSEAAVDALVEQAEGREEDSFSEGDLPALFLTPDERLAQIRERITARIPAYQGGPGGGRERQLMHDESDQAAHPGWRTEYADRADIGDRAASGDEAGRVLDENGDPMDGTWGWVMDEATGYLLFFPADEVTLQYPDGRVEVLTRDVGVPRWRAAQARGVVLVRTHHTTPVAGMPVTGAGIMTLQDGWIVEVTDESGHYQPTAANEYEAVEGMVEQGASFQRPVRREVVIGADGQEEERYVPAESWDDSDGYRDATVHLTGSGGGAGGRPTGKAEWIDPLHDQNPYVPTGDLDLSAQQFETTEGNEVQIRLKAGLNEEFEAKRGAQLRSEAGDSEPLSAHELGHVAQQGEPGAHYGVREGVPRNSLGEGYNFDPERQLFQQEATGHYYSASGELIYQWDPEQGRYYDHTSGTWL